MLEEAGGREKNIMSWLTDVFLADTAKTGILADSEISPE